LNESSTAFVRPRVRTLVAVRSALKPRSAPAVEPIFADHRLMDLRPLPPCATAAWEKRKQRLPRELSPFPRIRRAAPEDA
jgi:hypothetical protein